MIRTGSRCHPKLPLADILPHKWVEQCSNIYWPERYDSKLRWPTQLAIRVVKLLVTHSVRVVDTSSIELRVGVMSSYTHRNEEGAAGGEVFHVPHITIHASTWPGKLLNPLPNWSSSMCRYFGSILLNPTFMSAAPHQFPHWRPSTKLSDVY
jgi:hypothetical protein